jgi:hypothetical protein
VDLRLDARETRKSEEAETDMARRSVMPGNQPCPPNCDCEKHSRLGGWHHSEETARKISAAKTGGRHSKESIELMSKNRRGIPAWNKGIPASEEQKQKQSDALLGRPLAESHKAAISAGMTGKGFGGAYAYQGGDTGAAYARILCPAGFMRTFFVAHGSDGKREKYELDFAHSRLKINIELDGPFHVGAPDEDMTRDAFLRSAGWIVIRIPHR